MNQTILCKAISEVKDAELKGKCCCASPFSQSFSVSLIACHGMTFLSWSWSWFWCVLFCVTLYLLNRCTRLGNSLQSPPFFLSPLLSCIRHRVNIIPHHIKTHTWRKSHLRHITFFTTRFSAFFLVSFILWTCRPPPFFSQDKISLKNNIAASVFFSLGLLENSWILRNDERRDMCTESV